MALDDTIPNDTSADLPSQAGFDSGDNSEVSTTAFVHDPVLAQYQTPEYQAKWLEELEASRKERKSYIDRGYKILEHWADKRSQGNQRCNFNLLYSNTEMKKAALYARTPEPDIKRRFNDPNDQVSRVAALILQRKLITELDEEKFDDTAENILMDRLIPGMGIAWVRLEQLGGDDLIVPETQQVIQSPVTHQATPIDHVSWDDFYWSPCRTWKLCRWMARHLPMSREAVKERFGECAPPEVLANLSYEQQKDKDKDKGSNKDQLRTKNAVESTTSVYEIWDKELRLVWWIAESADVPLDVQKDTNEFPGFFPTPAKPLGRFDGSNTLPWPDYHFAQDLYRQLDQINDRQAKMIEGAQVKWVYDASNAELKDLFTTASEFTGIPVNNWNTFTEKGGLQNSIQFIPYETLVEQAAALNQMKALVVEQILQVEGLSGPFQAQSVPNETIIQTQQKAAFGTTRMSIAQKDVAKYIEELLKLKAHLICKFYTPEMLLQGTGTLSPTDQALVPQAIALLKNEQLRNFNLTVSVDSIQLPNWNLEKADKTQAFQAITGAMANIIPAVEQNPALGPLALGAVKWLITGFKDTQYIEGEIDNALQNLERSLQQKQGQPPKPSPAEIKAQSAQQKNQTDLAIAQIEAQTKQQLAAINAKVEAMDLELRKSEQQLHALQTLANIHDQAKNTVHDHAMDIASTREAEPAPPQHGPDLTIVLGGPK